MLKKDLSQQSNSELKKAQLGRQLRACRKQQSLTMQFVADSAGLSVGFISQVERGLTVPSLASLVAIAGVLQQPISRFLDQPVAGSELTRQRDRVPYNVAAGSLSYERLSTNFTGSSLRSVIVHEPPGHRVEPISHEGEEMFYVLAGEITVEIDGCRTILLCGDSIHFDSQRTHSTWNHTTGTASILWCGTMDVFGDDEPDPIHKLHVNPPSETN